MASYEGIRVTTEWGTGTIRTLTGRSVAIDIDADGATISIVRGSHGWDRFVAANADIFA